MHNGAQPHKKEGAKETNNMPKTTLTQHEIIALKATLNYDSRETQHDDNYSCAGVEEFMAALNWNAQQVGGLIASLTEKGMGNMDDEGADLFWLTDVGIDTIFGVIEDEKNAEDLKAKGKTVAEIFREETAQRIEDALAILYKDTPMEITELFKVAETLNVLIDGALNIPEVSTLVKKAQARINGAITK